MIVVMQMHSSSDQLDNVIRRIKELGRTPHVSQGEKKTVVGMVGNGRPIDPNVLLGLPGVESVVPILNPFKLASREFKETPTVVQVGNVAIGGSRAVVMAGPCAVESREQILEAAAIAKHAGARVLRGGAFKPRTSPYSFKGLGEEGLRLLREAGNSTGLPIVTEVISPQDVALVASYADMLQIGARNMQNFALLDEVGRTRHPVLLKRGLMATIEELLMAAEYILSNGNSQVVLCERGIRSFERYTRNTLDISAIPVIKSLSHLPVIVDPSHAVGMRHLVAPVSKGAIAAGADGLIIEVHPRPDEAASDSAQTIGPEAFGTLMDELRKIAGAVGRSI